MRILLSLLIGILLPAISSASIYTYQLNNHPGGNAGPPLYGLRLDNLFAGDGFGGTTTFDFDHSGSAMFAQIDDVNNKMYIFGRAVGGVDSGNSYSTNATIDVFFVYSGLTLAGTFDPLNPGIVVPSGSGMGTVSVTASDKAVLVGDSFDLTSKVSSRTNEAFNFRNTLHRGINGLNGWGWLQGSGSGTRDWLFTGEYIGNNRPLVPEPGTFVIWSALGLAGFCGSRRRRQ